MTNAELASMLAGIAELLDVKGEVVFKTRAYARAARVVESHPHALAELYSQRGIAGLTAIEGIGEGIARKLEEMLRSGRVAFYEELRGSLPQGIEELLQVPGLGPKSALRIADRLGVRNLDDLERACRSGRVRALPRMGAKAEEKILAGIALRRQGMERRPLACALDIADALLAELRARPEVVRAEAAGSLRRRQETVGDLDLLVVSKSPEETVAFFTGRRQVERVQAAGKTKASVLLRPQEPGDAPFPCDLRVVHERSLGAALHYFTGSKEHNLRIREIGVKAGLKINEYGVFRAHASEVRAHTKAEERELQSEEDWKHWVGGRDEEEVFSAVSLPWIAPELREDGSEIDAAREGRLPRLVEETDIRGDLHAHTDWSDGSDTIERMARAAQERGYEYLAISDHSQGERQANGLAPDRVRRQLSVLSKLNEDFRRAARRFRLLAASECDILEDGSMDFPDDLLRELDIVVASVHTHWKLTEDRMTTRIERAISNPYVTVVAHPTGRLLQTRPPYAVDLPRLYRAAAENGTFLEIDSHPARLDFKDVHARAAKEAGCLLSVDSDAHTATQLANLRFGIWTARRAWLSAPDVANTRDLAALLALVNAKRTRGGGLPAPASKG